VLTLPATATHRLLKDAPALCQVISALHQRGWCDGTGGNFSSVLCEDPLVLLMAPSGVDKGSLQPADLIVVDGNGVVICGEGKASAETLLHLAIIRNTGAGAVLHTHSQAATLLSRNAQGASGSPAHQQPGSIPPNTSSDAQSHSAHPLPPAPNPEIRFPTLRTVSPDSGTVQQNHETRVSEPQTSATGPQTLALNPEKPFPGDPASTPPPLLGHLRLVDLEMLKGLEGIHSHNTAIAIPILANSQDMRQLSLAALPHLDTAPHGLLIAGHGLYVWGHSLPQARRHLEILEFLLEQHWRQRLLSALLKTESARP
jgi:ribulose-5-phosphate 4-epimerase/fuculose-1-phosphate aldolase